MDRFAMFCGAAAFFMLCYTVHTIAVAFFNAPVESFFVICCLVLLAMTFFSMCYEMWRWISKERRDQDVKQ